MLPKGAAKPCPKMEEQEPWPEEDTESDVGWRQLDRSPWPAWVSRMPRDSLGGQAGCLRAWECWTPLNMYYSVWPSAEPLG